MKDEHVMICDAIKECNFSGELLKDTDNSEKHRRDISQQISVLGMQLIQIQKMNNEAGSV